MKKILCYLIFFTFSFELFALEPILNDVKQKLSVIKKEVDKVGLSKREYKEYLDYLLKIYPNDMDVLYVHKISILLSKNVKTMGEAYYFLNNDTFDTISKAFIKLQFKLFQDSLLLDTVEDSFYKKIKELHSLYPNFKSDILDVQRIVYSSKLNVRTHIFYDIKQKPLKTLKKGEMIVCSNIFLFEKSEWCKIKNKNSQYIEMKYTKGLI